MMHLPDKVRVEVAIVTNERQFSKPVLILRDYWVSSETFEHHRADCVSHVKPETNLLCWQLHQQRN